MNRRLPYALLLCSVLVVAPTRAETATSCRPDFLAASRYAMSGEPVMLSTADINDDGLPDLVTATSNYGAAISVRLGQPDGGFGPEINQATNDSIQFAVVGKFTNDPAPDLVYSSYSGIQFLKGNGDGTFQNPVGLGVGLLNYLQAADVDGDGKLDLVGVEAQYSNNRITVLLGNGDGTFQPPVYTTPKVYPGAIAVGDVNGDGKADLVLTANDNQVYVYLGLGGGQFSAPTPFIAGINQRAVAIADVTGEGIPDVVVITDVYLAVLIGNGDGTFQAALDYPAGPAPYELVLADLNGDGALDAAVVSGPANYGSLGSVFALLNGGDGVFTQGTPYFALIGYPNAVASADFGNAGHADLALSGQDNFVSILRGNGDGTLDAVRLSPTSFQNGGPNGGLAVGDLNGDGVPDVVLSSSYSIRPFLATGGGVFAPGTEVFVNGFSVVAIAAGDFNGDGKLDLAVLLDVADAVEILLGQGDGTFLQTSPIPIPDFGGYGQTLAVGDFDGNGTLDLAVTKTDYSNANFALFVFPGIGDGTFGSPTETSLAAAVMALLAADFNEDGKADLAALTSYPSTVVNLFLSQGGGIFQPAVPYSLSDGSRGMTAADLRHSGHWDLVVGNANHNTLTIFPGQGNGSFGTPSIIGLGSSVAQVVAADFDGDGNVDLMTANASDDASVLFGLGNGAFRSPKEYPVGVPLAVAAGDFDGNGRMDAVFVNNDGVLGLSTLLNGGLGAVVPATSALVNGVAAIPVRASGYGPLTYQWRKSGVPLVDGGSVSGVTTSTLRIDPATFADANTYDVLVTDACGTVDSAPGTLSIEFADVPTTNIFHADIITIATAGVTAGCGGANYCPNSIVSRAQMAVFLLKSEHGSAYVPPPCTGLFADVACPSTYADWIERLANEQVTAGCGGGNYCPDASITRAQMAVFLLKTKLGSGYVPPPAVGIFGDVPVGSFAADWIEDLYNRGIAGGCSASPLLYCPNNPVNRGQMAALLVNTFF